MSKTVYTYHNARTSSSAISEIWYNRFTQELYVKFPGGTIAGYRDVPVTEADSMILAPSMGKHYSYEIKNHYPGINTEDIEFVEFDRDAYSVHRAAPARFEKQHSYTLTGVWEVKDTFSAATMDEAVKMFQEQYKGVHVKTASVEF